MSNGIRYLKITLTDGTRFILRVTRESPHFIVGIEVDAEGDEIVPRGTDPKGRPWHQRERQVQRETIKKAVEMRMNPKYATLEVVPREKKTPAQLDAEIAEALAQGPRRARAVRRTRQDHATKKRIPDTVRAAIEEHALDFIQGSYRRFETVGGKEPCLSVGLITDYLRQAHMPEDFRWATKDRQRTWTRSVLESMRRAGKIGSSSGVTSEGAQARCYEPKR